LLCLNTGGDIIPTLDEIVDKQLHAIPSLLAHYEVNFPAGTNAEEDFYRDGTHTFGITAEHISVLDESLRQSNEEGILSCSPTPRSSGCLTTTRST